MKEPDVHRLLELVDIATDPGWDDGLAARRTRDEDDNFRRDLVQERIASAIGAIAFLLLRQDEDAWDEWKRY